MHPQDRKDLFHLLTGLSDKLNEIAESSGDFDTADALHDLTEVIDESALHLMAGRK